MKFINKIRNLGWPDRRGHRHYGNAAVLCFLTFMQTHTEDLNAESADVTENSINTRRRRLVATVLLLFLSFKIEFSFEYYPLTNVEMLV